MRCVRIYVYKTRMEICLVRDGMLVDFFAGLPAKVIIFW